MKCIRDDKQFSLKADTISPQEDIPAQNTNIEQYVSALYDDNWYTGCPTVNPPTISFIISYDNMWSNVHYPFIRVLLVIYTKHKNTY